MQETTCNTVDLSLIPGLGRCPGEGNGYPLQCSCLGNPMDKGAWQAAVHGVTTVRHDLVTSPPPPGCKENFPRWLWERRFLTGLRDPLKANPPLFRWWNTEDISGTSAAILPPWENMTRKKAERRKESTRSLMILFSHWIQPAVKSCLSSRASKSWVDKFLYYLDQFELGFWIWNKYSWQDQSL